MDLAEQFRGILACNYNEVGALTFTIWDGLITLEDEAREIWRKPWTKLKTLYIAIRVVSLGTQILTLIFSMKLAAGTAATTRTCVMMVTVQAVATQILMMLVQVVLILRVKALYYQNRSLHYVLYGLLIAEAITMSVIFGCSLPQIRYGLQCTTISLPVGALGFFLPPIAFDFFLFSLTMVKFHQSLRDGWGREPVIARFMKDGIWAFFLPFSMLAINACCLTVLNGTFTSMAYPWAIAVPGFAGYRLILNMGYLLKMNQNMVQTNSNQVYLDTVPATYDSETEFTSLELRDYSTHCTISSTAGMSSSVT